MPTEETQAKVKPRTMRAGHEEAYRAAQSLDGCKAFMKELDAERAVSADLLAALKFAASIIGHPDDDGSKYIADVIDPAEAR